MNENEDEEAGGRGASRGALKQVSYPKMRLEANLACRREGRLIFFGIELRAFQWRGDRADRPERHRQVQPHRHALGRLRAAEGRIRLGGGSGGEHDDDRGLAELSHHVGHRDGLKTALTARENLAFAQAMLGEPASDPGEALACVGLPHVAALPVGLLSAGQRRRVALARLLVSRRPFWLLDEPWRLSTRLHRPCSPDS